jgi:glycolate oxidase
MMESNTYSTTNDFEMVVEGLNNILGKEFVFVDDENRNKYAHDETENLHFLPDIVIKPITPLEISAVMKFCNLHKIPVTPRGAGTGLSGGALPLKGGVLISF